MHSTYNCPVHSDENVLLNYATVPYLQLEIILFPFQVISGQQLPKPGDKKGEIIDPYVVLQLVGADCDSQRLKTKVVKDNGECTV